MDPECEHRMAQAIYAHVNMLISGMLEAIHDTSIIGPVLRLGVKKQFPILIKRLGLKRPESIDEAVKVINELGHACRLKKVEPKDPDVAKMYKVVAVFEDEELDKEAIRRARENFGAFTNISECIPLLISRAVNTGRYDAILRTYEEDGMIRVRVYIIER